MNELNRLDSKVLEPFELEWQVLEGYTLKNVRKEKCLRIAEHSFDLLAISRDQMKELYSSVAHKKTIDRFFLSIL